MAYQQHSGCWRGLPKVEPAFRYIFVVGKLGGDCKLAAESTVVGHSWVDRLGPLGDWRQNINQDIVDFSVGDFASPLRLEICRLTGGVSGRAKKTSSCRA